MSSDARKSRFFYGYVVIAAGFGIWFIGWGTFTPCFGVFFGPPFERVRMDQGSDNPRLFSFIYGAGRCGNRDGMAHR